MLDLNDTQEKIAKSYIQLCYKHGASKVNDQMVADALRLSLGTVRYQFQGKKLSLVDVAILYSTNTGKLFTEKHIDKVRKEKTKHSLLRAYVEAHFLWFEKHPDVASFYFYYLYLESTTSKLLIDGDQLFQVAIDRIKSLAFESIGRKSIDSSINIDLEAYKTYMFLLGGLLRYHSIKDEKTKRHIRNHCIEQF